MLASGGSIQRRGKGYRAVCGCGESAHKRNIEEAAQWLKHHNEHEHAKELNDDGSSNATQRPNWIERLKAAFPGSEYMDELDF